MLQPSGKLLWNTHGMFEEFLYRTKPSARLYRWFTGADHQRDTRSTLFPSAMTLCCVGTPHTAGRTSVKHHHLGRSPQTLVEGGVLVQAESSLHNTKWNDLIKKLGENPKLSLLVLVKTHHHRAISTS